LTAGCNPGQRAPLLLDHQEGRMGMDKILVASSPVEIEAKAEAAGLPRAVHDLALALFHGLTDRLGRAARSLPGRAAHWPSHRFYFADAAEPEMTVLLQGLEHRPDFAEVGGATYDGRQPAGLFVRDARDGYVGVLVGHENHEGLRSPLRPELR
jgi:hypothetical protein